MVYGDDWYAGTASKGALKSFEIVTDSNDVVIIRGSRDEATDQKLTGKVLLDLKSTVHGKVRLRLTRRIRHTERIHHAGDPFGQPNSVDLVFHEHDVWDEYLVADNQKFGPGQHSWNFDIPIKADTAASLEGPPTTYVVYRLKCVIERGVLAKDFIQKKHIRIHRTLQPDSLALQQAMITDSYWKDKCAYVIQTPTKGIIYGTQVPMEYKLAPLGKGIRPIRAKCTVSQVIRFHRSAYSRTPFKTRDIERNICEDLLEIPESLEQDVESFYTISQKIKLPDSLAKCCQTYKESSVPDIEIRHYINYKLGISNPDGHVSEIQGRLPIHLFFLQDMRVQNDSTHVQGVPTDLIADPMEDALNDIPPNYADCQRDELVLRSEASGVNDHVPLHGLYSAMPISGFATPGPQSGSHTPSGSMTPRSHSHSNLNILAGIEDDEDGQDEQTNANTKHNLNDDFIRHGDSDSPRDNEPDANALRNRLERVKLGAGSRFNSSRHGDVSGSAGSGGSRSGAHSPVSIVRNRSFQSANTAHSPMAHSPLAHASMTPALEIDNPLLDRPRPARTPSTGPSITVDHHSGASHSTSHSTSPDGSGAVTPGGIRSAHPTRPSSPVHMEDLNRVPSYNTAITTPAPSGSLGSQHGGFGLPTYFEVESESASRNGSITGSCGGSGGVTPATTGGRESSDGAAMKAARPGGGLEGQGRSRSGIFSSFLHKHR